MGDREFITLIFILFINLLVTAFMAFTLPLMTLELIALGFLLFLGFWFLFSHTKLSIWYFLVLSTVNMSLTFAFTYSSLYMIIIIINLVGIALVWYASSKLIHPESFIYPKTTTDWVNVDAGIDHDDLYETDYRPNVDNQASAEVKFYYENPKEDFEFKPIKQIEKNLFPKSTLKKKVKSKVRKSKKSKK